MAESDTQNTGRLTAWIILIFVLVVMGLLIADLGSNIEGELDRSNRPDGTMLNMVTCQATWLPRHVNMTCIWVLMVET